MEIHQAVMAFKRRLDRSNFPFDAQWRNLDVWPEAATAAVVMAGALDDAKDDDDLDAALSAFLSLYDPDGDGPINYPNWRAEIERTMQAMARLAEDVAERARLAVRQRRAAKFSLN